MRILKILLFFLGLFIFVLGTDAYLGVDDVITALNEAVELDAPVILPENEGKIVILHGVPEMTASVYDEELGLTLHTVKAMRYKESYDLVSRDDGKSTWEWVGKGMETLVGEAKAGEFMLSDQILISLPADSDYKDFDPQEAERYNLDRSLQSQSVVYVLPKDAYYYAEEALSSRDNSLIGRSSYAVTADRTGTVAYHYRSFDAGKYDAMTFVGRQAGNMLIDSGVDGVLRVYTDIKTREEIVGSNKTMLVMGSRFGMVCGAAMMILAAKKKNRKTDVNQNQKRKKG